MQLAYGTLFREPEANDDRIQDRRPDMGSPAAAGAAATEAVTTPAPPRSALVTGASGFIGGHLVPALLDRGWAVRTCGRRTPEALPAEVEHRTADLASGDLGDAVAGVTHVFHLAGASSSLSDVAEMRRSNVATTANLLDAIEARGGSPPRLLYLSTSAVYGEDAPLPSPITEAVEPQPSRPYGQTKWEAEQLVWDRVRAGLPATVLRPVSVYGPGAIKLLASSILDAAIERRAGLGTLELPAEPVELRLVHIEDVIGAALHLIDSDAAAGHPYNLADGIYPSSHRLGAAIAAALGLGVETGSGGGGLTHADRVRIRDGMLAEGMDGSILLTERRLAFLGRANRNNRLSIDALAAVGFRPAITDLEAAVAGAVAWYAAHRWIL